MARNSTEELGGEYDLEPRGSTISCVRWHRVNSPSKHLQVWYYVDFKGVMF